MRLEDALQKKIIFVQGKGGVGKSTLAHAAAHTLAKRGERTLLVLIEDPRLPPGRTETIGPNLDRVNCEPATAFEQYAGMKVGSAILAKIFTHNKLMRYLVQAAPGIKELTVMGKIWFERKNYAHVVVDMPATGHGITLFQSIENWRRLFAGSPLEKDSKAMTETFSDPSETAHLIVALPEEMPMVEALELEEKLVQLHPSARACFILNRLFPTEGIPSVDPEPAEKPFAGSLDRHLAFRLGMEKNNESLWKARAFERIPYFLGDSPAQVASRVTTHLTQLELRP